MAISRREFLKMGTSSLIFVVAGEVFFGTKVSAEMVQRFNDMDLITLLKEMPEFEGIFVIETKVLNLFADDFGHYVHKMPLGVLKPANSSDIQKMAAFCLEKEIPLTMRGAGGSVYGQTQLQEGIIIDSSSMKKMMWISQDLIQLEPGLQWSEVLDYTIQSNRTPYVLPDVLVTSVGGTVNAGGVGETSFVFGSLIDHVVEFDLVTMEGVELTCNEDVNVDLFHAALGSMGQFGFITRVVLRTMVAPTEVYSRQFTYAGVDYRYLTDMQMITQSELYGAIGGHLVRSSDPKIFNYVLDVTHWGESESQWLQNMSVPQSEETKIWSFYDYAHRNTKAWKESVRKGAWKLPHPYMSFHVPFEQAQEVANYLQQTELATLGASKIVLMPLVNQNLKKPLFKFADEGLTAHFRIYRIALGAEGSAIHQSMLKANEEILLPKIFEMSGTVYLPFSPLLNEEQKVAQFEQSHLDTLRLLKQKFDSEGLVNSGAGLF